jgi:para-nitrobenzyl esterase
VYRFERTVPGKGEAALGAFHSLELPYVFGTFEARAFKWMPFTEVDRRLSGTIQSYWINFAKNGNPNGEGVPLWAEWNGADEPYVSFGSGGGAVPAKNFSPMYCHLSAERLKEQLGN